MTIGNIAFFVHEYVHYYQHFATLYGSQFCKMANLLFIETRAFLEGADKVVIPFGIWEHNEGISYDCPNLDDTTKSEISRRLGDKVFGGGIGSPEKACGCTILNSVIFRFFKGNRQRTNIYHLQTLFYPKECWIGLI